MESDPNFQMESDPNSEMESDPKLRGNDSGGRRVDARVAAEDLEHRTAIGEGREGGDDVWVFAVALDRKSVV